MQGRVLTSSPVLYKQSKSCVTTSASWNMIGKQFSAPGRLSNWSWLTLGTATFSPASLNQFKTALGNAGMSQEPPMVPPQSAQPGYHAGLSTNEEDNDKSIKNVFNVLKEHGVRFLLVILQDSSAIVYSRVKFWAHVETGKFSNFTTTRNSLTFIFRNPHCLCHPE